MHPWRSPYILLLCRPVPTAAAQPWSPLMRSHSPEPPSHPRQSRRQPNVVQLRPRRSDRAVVEPKPLVSPQALDDPELRQLRDVLDHAVHASLARFTGGLSPAALTQAYAGWGVHLAISPGKQVELAAKAAGKWVRFARYASACAMRGGTCQACIEPLP